MRRTFPDGADSPLRIVNKREGRWNLWPNSETTKNKGGGGKKSSTPAIRVWTSDKRGREAEEKKSLPFQKASVNINAEEDPRTLQERKKRDRTRKKDEAFIKRPPRSSKKGVQSPLNERWKQGKHKK